MKTYAVRFLIFFASAGLGLIGFLTLEPPWDLLSFFAFFLVGGTASMVAFKRMATEEQRKSDLEARLHND